MMTRSVRIDGPEGRRSARPRRDPGRASRTCRSAAIHFSRRASSGPMWCCAAWRNALTASALEALWRLIADGEIHRVRRASAGGKS